jgi:protein gp37
MSTAIQWTDVTDNIIVVEGGGWWCRKISPGCANCYAEKLNQSSYFDGNKLKYVGEPPKLKLREEIIAGWERQTKPKKHFVASMTDIFGDWVPQEWVFQFLDGMAAAPLQTFQLLTKRADVMRDQVLAWLRRREFRRVPQNIWLGVSVEDRARKDRLEMLSGIQAVKFASFEPLLEDLKLVPAEIRMLNWAIIGGESGPDARPCDLEWIRKITATCRAADVAPFVKQLGSAAVQAHAEYDFTLYPSTKKGGDMAEWPEDLRVREFPALARGGRTT